MVSGDQAEVPAGELGGFLADAAARAAVS